MNFRFFFLIFKARIKKIMQADEDVGKIALAVPVLVCESFFFFFTSVLRIRFLLNYMFCYCSKIVGVVLARPLRSYI